MRTFSLHSFPPDLGGKKLVGSGGKFSSEFSVLSFFLCFLNSGKHCFHTIFHPLFSILLIIPPTKHSVSEMNACGSGIFTKLVRFGIEIEGERTGDL